jgi:hypothetical protein
MPSERDVEIKVRARAADVRETAERLDAMLTVLQEAYFLLRDDPRPVAVIWVDRFQQLFPAVAHDPARRA